MIPAVLVGCGGFLLAVLWMDLMFDVQVRRVASSDPDTSAAALASIAAYYRRVTTDAAPMNRLIGIVMVAQLGGIAAELLTRRAAGWLGLAVAVLGAGPITLALLRIVPDAARLGAGCDAPARRAALAQRIYLAHVVCFVAIAAFVGLQLRLAGG